MAQERSPEQGWDKGEGKAVKVAMKAKKESGGKMWHKKKPWPRGEKQAVIASDTAERVGRAGRSLDQPKRRSAELSRSGPS